MRTRRTRRKTRTDRNAKACQTMVLARQEMNEASTVEAAPPDTEPILEHSCRGSGLSAPNASRRPTEPQEGLPLHVPPTTPGLCSLRSTTEAATGPLLLGGGGVRA